ncbi:glycosyltransferase family 4 protein [Wenyingzhuangia sp. chi5]|uniref:Glycosyltransferase family 4 protein n=1 Tax=Wenyingzhuangia gilva TaxID=3057677 RepID=A0ABT8VT61_9FLAO|nr:glycosyltransferase family 4 protein [Wenyingzhuangia sp. chi5]MDO3695132.1 glycosyltransferase family 4 protein [Wenyingzhuangia sp. chi5]
MKIAVICNYVLRPDRIGGMDRFYQSYNQKLIEMDIQVDWYFTNYTSFEFYKGMNIYSAEGASVEQLFLNQNISKNNNYEAIVTHFTELCTSFYKECHQLYPNANIIAVDHNPRPLEGFPLKKRIKKRIAGLLYAKYIHQFVGVSQYTVNHILNDYGAFLKDKTKVVYNGIDTKVFIKRTQENKNKFIVASHLRASKGIQDLIKAFSLIDNSALNNVVVDIYGEGPYEQVLRDLTVKYSLEDVIFFKGSSAKLNELFCDYAYMIQPTYMECFSLSILESLSANVPVITTTVGGNLEVLENGKNGFIYEPGDSKALASILEKVITDKKNITDDTATLIQQEFYLDKMVSEHIKLLPCT